jgi:hypothetical protein
MNNNDILTVQNELLYKLNNIHKKYIDIFLDYIIIKTRNNFNIMEYNNQYYILYYNNYKFVFDLQNNSWLLVQDNKLLYESKLIDEIIYNYLYVTNKLSICLHQQSMDPDTEILNNIFNNLSL